MKRETRQTLAYFNNHCEAIQERKKFLKVMFTSKGRADTERILGINKVDKENN